MQLLKRISLVLLSVVMLTGIMPTAAYALEDDMAVVETAEVLVKSLVLNTHKITWTVGKSGHFKPTISPANATNKTLKWSSSDSSVATVSPAGKLTAVSEGTAKIFCETTDGSEKLEICDVKVIGKNIKATSLKLNAKKITWPIGKSGHFKPTVLPADASNKKLSWTSSVKRVASVDANGKLTALSEGTTTITCKTTDGTNLKATCVVTVTDGIKVKSLKLNCKTINWEVGKSASFRATVTPSNATNKTLKWTSSDPKVATVSSTGKLTAVGAGKTTITCATTDGTNLKATCAVTVRAVKATGLKLNASRINWIVGKTGTFKATITPSNASVKQLEWHSSNLKVATVSQDGFLTAVFPGTTTITCSTTDGSNLKATCKVTVYDPDNIPVTSLEFFSETDSWAIGKSGYLKTEVAPANATNKNLTWHSSNDEIATIDEDGKLTAKSEGTAIITCKTTDGSDIIKSCKIFVYNPIGIKATSLRFDKEILNWKVSQSGTIKAKINPSIVTNETLDWSTSNSDVVIINDEGFIKAISVGVAVITARTVDGSKLKATCKVVVSPADKSAEDYEGSGLLGFAWDPAQKCFFSARYAWQRNFGFCELYDVAAPFTVMYYDTVRVKFRYDDKDWMIQLWKGQYGIFLGCEIGVYYKDIDNKVEFYDCVEDKDLLFMDSTLYRDDKKLFTRKYDKYWWITGFKTGALKNIQDRSELIMNSTITFHTKEMMDAFLVAFEDRDFHEGEDYWVCGKSVTFTWQYQNDGRLTID